MLMVLITCYSFADSGQRLWIGHVPTQGSSVDMTLYLVNRSERPEEMVFDVYSQSGSAVDPVHITVPANETLAVASEDLFGPEASHAAFSSGSVSVRWSYALSGALNQQPLFEPSDGLSQKMLVDWHPVDSGTFGVAIVNTSDQPAQLVWSTSGAVLNQMSLGPYEKRVLDFSGVDASSLSLDSDQTFAFVAAQVSQSGTDSSYIPKPGAELKRAQVDLVDDNLRALVMQIADNSPRDGHISLYEAKQIQCINAQGLAIRSIGGLELFTELRKLDLSDNFIHQLTSESLPVSLEELTLSGNPLTEVPDLSALPELLRLDLANCSFSNVPRLVHARLESIDLTRSGIVVIDLSGMPMLKELRLGFNPLDPSQLTLPGRLTHLALNGCLIRSIQLDLPELVDLDLSDNVLSHVTLETPRLTYLNLAKAQLTTVPVAPLPRLRDLIIDDNPIRSLDSISSFTTLEHLCAERIKETPLAFTNEMPFLRTLDFSDGRHTTANFYNCPSLEEVDLSGNNLHEIPAVHPLAPLRILNLSRNSILSLTPATHLNQLQQLNLSFNRIEAIPSVWRNPELEHLDLSWNRLARIPGEWTLLGLKWLDVSYNYVEDFDVFFRLDQMTDLNLTSNRLSVLPPCMP